MLGRFSIRDGITVASAASMAWASCVGLSMPNSRTGNGKPDSVPPDRPATNAIASGCCRATNGKAACHKSSPLFQSDAAPCAPNRNTGAFAGSPNAWRAAARSLGLKVAVSTAFGITTMRRPAISEDEAAAAANHRLGVITVNDTPRHAVCLRCHPRQLKSCSRCERNSGQYPHCC